MAKKPWQMTAKHWAAIQYFADGLRPEEVAVKLKADGHEVSVRTLYNWMSEEAFSGVVDGVKAKVQRMLQQKIEDKSLGNKEARLAAIEDIYQRHMLVLIERGEEMAEEVAGGRSGLFYRDTDGSIRRDRALIEDVRTLVKESAEVMGESGNGEGGATGFRIILE